MKLPALRVSLSPIFSVLLISCAMSCFASDERETRDVRLTYVKGDVRLSRGNGKHPDLRKPWEQALSGEPIARGFSLSTGDGRVEIVFEDGSTIYLAENSLLLFTELSASENRKLTSLTLATGTATFWLWPLIQDVFYIQTPTDVLTIAAPEAFYCRIDAYLDATALTPQSQSGMNLVRHSLGNFLLNKGETVFVQQGDIVDLKGTDSTESQSGLADRAIPAFPSMLLFPALGSLALPQDLPPVQPKLASSPIPAPPMQVNSHPLAPKTPPSAWDIWVSTRVQKENAEMTAALRASGLFAPIPGLLNLYRYGTFFDCEYGRCWDPSEQEPDRPEPNVAPQTQSPSANTQAAPKPTALVFQPQTVLWQERWQPWCGPVISQSVTRLPRTPQELEMLLRKKQRAESAVYASPSYWADCYFGYWFRHHGHYARVITPVIARPLPPRRPPSCQAIGCRPPHPHPVPVRLGKQVGFVPRHPKDVDGKPPLNLKNGVLVPPSKTNQNPQHLMLDSASNFRVIAGAPKESQTSLSFHAAPVIAPDIHAHLMPGTTLSGSVAATNQSPAPITYDYKRQSFTMPRNSGPSEHLKPVAIGGITPHGTVASFADGHSFRYAASFDRASGALASIRGSHAGDSNSGAHSSAPLGTSHNSGSYSAGAHNTGPYSGTHSSASYSGGGHSSSSSSSSYSGGSAGSSHSGGTSGGGSTSSGSSASSDGNSPHH